MTMLLPPGARFAPTEEELITHYLNKKISGQPFPQNFVVERELYDMAPWKVFEDQSDPWQTSKVRNKGGSVVGTDRVIYVITKLKKASQSRISRVAGCGVWHGEGGPYKIWDNNGVIIGTEKTYSFQVPHSLVDGIPNKQGHWIMHEFSSCMGTETNSNNYVICKISRDDSKPIKRAPPSSSSSSSRKTRDKKNDKVSSIKRAKPDITSVEEEEDLLQWKKLKRNNEEAKDNHPPTCDGSIIHTIEDEYDKYAADNTLGEQAGYFRTEVDQKELLLLHVDFDVDDCISKHPNFSQDLDLFQGMRNEEGEDNQPSCDGSNSHTIQDEDDKYAAEFNVEFEEEEEENNNNNNNNVASNEDEECLHKDFDFSDNADYLISKYRNLFQRMSKDEFDQLIRLQENQPPVEWTNS